MPFEPLFSYRSHSESTGRTTLRQNGYNMQKHWTEFKLVSVFAAHQLLLHNKAVGIDFATRYYSTIVSLTLIPHYYVEEEGLLVKGAPSWQQKTFPNSECDSCEPDLVDYPPQYLDGFVSPKNRSVVDNAYVVAAADAMVDIATAVGNTADALKFAAIAAKVRAAVVDRMFDATTGLFIDGVASNHSALAAQYFPAAFGFIGNGSNMRTPRSISSNKADPNTRSPQQIRKMEPITSRGGQVSNVKPLLDLIEAKTIALAKEPVCSCMGAHWLLQGLYTIGAVTSDTVQGARAAAMAQAFLQSPYTWRGMLAAGATTTMEVWTKRDKPNLSWSHPWCSAPANAIPRLLMGVAPLAFDFARFSVYPQPGNLTTATLSLATIHGVVSVQVNQTTAEVVVTVTVPAGSVAHACLPQTGVKAGGGAGGGDSTNHIVQGVHIHPDLSLLTVDGKVVAPVLKGRMLCAPADLLPGTHTLIRS
jgi:hypothetical protein